MSKTVLFVGAGSVQAQGIKRAKELGFHVISTDSNPHAPGLALADEGVVLDVKDVSGTLALARKHKIEGILCVAAEVAVRTVAEVGTALGLPTVNPEGAKNATSKHRMRALWEASEIPSARWLASGQVEEIVKAAEDIGFPVVVKPTDSAGSRGVTYVHQAECVSKAFTRALGYSDDLVVIVEEYMPGVELSVEAFVYCGETHVIAMSDKKRTEPPYLLDTAVMFPSSQPSILLDQAQDIVKRAVSVLGIDNSPIHAEIMITPEGPKMVELGARGPGFKVFTDMIPWSCGIDVLGESIRMAVGEEPNLKTNQMRGAALVFPQAKPGVLSSIDGVDKARSLENIRDVEIYLKPGDSVKPLTSGTDRIGHIIALAQARDEAEEAAERASRCLRLKYKISATPAR